MYRPRLIVLTLTVLALVFAMVSAPTLVQAQDTAQQNSTTRTMLVVGEGMVRMEPDVARATIGVDVMRSSVREASSENRAIVEAVMDALQEQGIAPEDMQTSGFSVFAERFGPEGPLPENETLYRVTNSISVTIRELDTVGAVLDAAVEAGANNIYGVEFGLEETDEAEAEARRMAVENAVEQANQLAEYAGVSLGEIVSISQVIGAGTPFLGGQERFAAGMGGGGGTPIVPGQIEVSALVQITYAIGE